MNYRDLIIKTLPVVLLLNTGCSKIYSAYLNNKYDNDCRANVAKDCEVYLYRLVDLSNNKEDKISNLSKLIYLLSGELKKPVEALHYIDVLVNNLESNFEKVEWYNKAGNIALEKLNNFEKSIEYFHKVKALSVDEDIVNEAHLKIANSYFRKEDEAQAIAELQELLMRKTLSPDLEYRSKFLKSKILAESGYAKKSVVILKGLTEKLPNLSKKYQAPWYLALAYEDLGEFKKSIKTLEDFLKIDPDNEIVKNHVISIKERLTVSGKDRKLTR